MRVRRTKNLFSSERMGRGRCQRLWEGRRAQTYEIDKGFRRILTRKIPHGVGQRDYRTLIPVINVSCFLGFDVITLFLFPDC